MALSSLADAPLLSKSSESSLPPLGRSWSRARHDDRSIDALFDEGLVGIDEESPLEMPVSTKTSSFTDESTRTDSAQDDHSVSSVTGKKDDAENQCSTPTIGLSVKPAMSSQGEECKPETPPDEEIFKKKWKENHVPPPSLEKKSSFDSLFSHVPSAKLDQEPWKKKDDDWGESTDILSMLPDGSEGDFNKKPERRPSNISKKLATERPDTPFEFGEYQPSCLSGRTPIAGRRRMSPTNFSSTIGKEVSMEAASKLSDNTRHTRKEGDDITSIIPVTPPVDKQAKPTPARKKVQPKPYGISFANGLENLSSQDSEESGSDKRTLPDCESSESTLFERLRQTLVSKGNLESEKNQLTNEVKQLKSENSTLKEEILKVEKEKLRLEKEISEIEISSNSAMCKQFSEDKEEAQKIVVQLSSEIHLLKNTCILADGKLSSLQKIYQEEVDILKSSHAREIEAKEKQLNSERAFVANQKNTMETLAHLVSKSNDWCAKVDEIQHWMVTEKENSNKFRTEWLDGFERSMHQQHTFMNEWQNQVEELMRILSLSVHNIKDLQTCERDSLLKERAHLQALQEAVQRERSQSLADLTSTRQKMDEIRSMCLQEKESFLQKCFEEKKELASERDAVLRMKEQLYHADASLEKQLLEHAARIQNETGELSKQRSDLEKARVMAAEIAQEVEDGRRHLEMRYQELDREKRFYDTENSTTDARHGCGRKNRSRTGEQEKRASDPATPLFKLIQHNPWNDTVKQLRKKVKRKFDIASSSSCAPQQETGEELMANTEALLRLQEQQQFLHEAEKCLKANERWTKKFLGSGKNIP